MSSKDDPDVIVDAFEEGSPLRLLPLFSLFIRPLRIQFPVDPLREEEWELEEAGREELQLDLNSSE